jgi:hypothetical protein
MILDIFRNRVLSPQQRDQWDLRLMYFDWPTGCQRITFNLGSRKLKRWSMSQFKIIALICPSLFINMLCDEDAEHVANMVEIVDFYTGYDVSSARIQDLKARIGKMFESLISRFPSEDINTTLSTYKLPNLHYIMEYIVRDVGVFGHRFGECLSEEHSHQKVDTNIVSNDCCIYVDEPCNRFRLNAIFVVFIEQTSAGPV